MRRWLLTWSTSLLVLPACGVVESSSATLPPLEHSAARATTDITVQPSAAPVPHRSWYYLHSNAVDDELRAMRALSSALTTADDADWLALICTTGFELDQPSYVAAYTAPGAHPDWVAAVDLTRWMIAGCSTDARTSVDGVLPLVQAALARFERWVAPVVDD